MTAKHHKVLIPASVEAALKIQYNYILKEQFSPINANQWLDGIIKAIKSLEKFPSRCAIAPENYYVKKDAKIIIRHFIYKKTFRIIFTIVKNEVRILNVKHSARFH